MPRAAGRCAGAGRMARGAGAAQQMQCVDWDQLDPDALSLGFLCGLVKNRLNTRELKVLSLGLVKLENWRLGLVGYIYRQAAQICFQDFPAV